MVIRPTHLVRYDIQNGHPRGQNWHKMKKNYPYPDES